MQPQPIQSPAPQQEVAGNEHASGGFAGLESSTPASPIQSAANSSPQVQQLKALQAGVDASPMMQQRKAVAPPVDSRPSNRNGLPGTLKAGIEQLSGEDMSDVEVHYNSSKPAEHDAEAFAQGSEIHLAPGKEHNLPHEAWHAAQQKAGRVAPTGQEGEEDVNTSVSLEEEADRMGAAAMRVKLTAPRRLRKAGAKSATKQFKRGGVMQFARRAQKAKERARKQQLKENQGKISGDHAWLKEKGRKYRALFYEVRNLVLNPVKGEDYYGTLKKHKLEYKADSLVFAEIQARTGIVDMTSDTCPVIMSNLDDAIKAIRKLLRMTAAEEIQYNREDSDLTSAMENLGAMEKEINGLPKDAVQDNEAGLLVELRKAENFAGGRPMEGEILRTMTMSPSSAKSMLQKDLTGKKYTAIKSKYPNKNEAEVADAVFTELTTFRSKQFYIDRAKQYAQLGAKAMRSTVETEYKEEVIKCEQLGIKGEEVGIGKLFKDLEIKKLFGEMATEVYTNVADKNVKKKNEEEKAKVDQKNIGKQEGLKEKFIPKQRTETDIVNAINGRFSTSGAKLTDVLPKALAAGTERFTNFFEEFPELLDQCLSKVQNTGIHQTLLDIKKGGKQHSIQNINDYVGDKLNEPLMRWVMDKGLSVEVHAMTILGSFAKLKTEGFTDVVEIPSAHQGTKKWIAVNPKTKKAKVVFQTLPGESYAIQTAGAFLFYEIYDVVPKSQVNIEVKNVKDSAIVGQKKEFVEEGFKARNMMETAGGKAFFILVSDDGKKFKKVAVPYQNNVPTIGDKGEILLKDVAAESVITTEDINVRTLDDKKLSVFSEKIDYKQVYIDTLKSYGVKNVDIACIGREGALTKALAGEGVTPKGSIDQIHFKGKIYTLKGVQKGQDDVNVTGDHTLLTLSISPDFFGSKAGFLMDALKEMGVKNISFVGTAGGLAVDSKVGDVMAPKELANFSDGKTEGTKFTNKAQDLLEEEDGQDGLDQSKFKQNDLHYGVHSPITESQEMIDQMKKLKVESVDCEAGFIANALKNSGVDLYAFFFVGDVPGTHHSIGQGGTAEIEGGQVEEVAQTEKAVLAMIKKAVGRKLENSATALQTLTYSIDPKGDITGLKEPVTDRAKTINVRLVIPKTAVDSRTPGIIKNFNFKVDEILRAENGYLNGEAMDAINTLADDFLSLYGIKFVVKFP
jgi:nucleoside phosphorylase